jgi:hypothetical protein
MRSGSEEKPRLTEGQRRRLEVRLSGLVAEAREWLDWSRREREDDDSEPLDWLVALRTELSHLIETIERTATSVGVSTQRREAEPERQVAGWASIWWASILDCRPEALAGFGRVDPELARQLEPATEEMAACLFRIKSAAEAARRGDGR